VFNEEEKITNIKDERGSTPTLGAKKKRMEGVTSQQNLQT
jgi:hypothetical protein